MLVNGNEHARNLTGHKARTFNIFKEKVVQKNNQDSKKVVIGRGRLWIFSEGIKVLDKDDSLNAADYELNQANKNVIKSRLQFNTNT